MRLTTEQYQRRSAVYRLTCPLQQSAFPTSGSPSSRDSIPLAEAPSDPAVGISTFSSRDFPLQQSGFPYAIDLSDPSEENSDEREPARDPSGARVAPSAKTPHPFESEAPGTV